MIQEFIEQNGLKAEIISFATEVPVSAAIKLKKFNPKNIAQINIFGSKKKDEILTITSFGKKASIEKIESIIGEEVLELNEEECLELTGYKKRFLPPISIYGVKVFIDVNLENLEYLVFPLSIKKFIKISLDEICSFNEDVSFEKILDN